MNKLVSERRTGIALTGRITMTLYQRVLLIRREVQVVQFRRELPKLILGKAI